MATMPFDLLGVYFKNTFKTGSFVQFSTIPRGDKEISLAYNLRARGNADMAVNDFKLKYTASSKTSAAMDTERDLNVIESISENATKFEEEERYQSFQDAETHEEYQLWPTPFIFRPPDDETRFLAFLDGQGGTSNRRYLGAYYELCVYHAFKAYFNDTEQQKITPLDLLVGHDMLMMRGTNFAQVVRTIGIRFLQSLDKGLVGQDSGQLKTHFGLGYQKSYTKGDTTKFIDFLFTPTRAAKKLQLTGRFHGLGEVAWEYSYDAEVMAEMKSEVGTAKKLSAPGRAAIKQNAAYSSFAVPVFFGLLKVESEPGTENVGEYGVISTLTEPSKNATTAYWELGVDNVDRTSYFPRHLVNSTPRMRFTEKTNIWYYNKPNSKQNVGVLLTEPGFFIPFTKQFIFVLNPFQLKEFLGGIVNTLPSDDSKYQYACLYNGPKIGKSTANFLFLQLNFEANEEDNERVCVLFYLNKGGKDGDYIEYDWPELTDRFTKDIKTNWDTFNDDKKSDFKFIEFCEVLFGKAIDLSAILPKVPDDSVVSTPLKFDQKLWAERTNKWEVQSDKATYTRIDGQPGEMYCQKRDGATVELSIENGRTLQLPKTIRLKVEEKSSCLVRCEVKRAETAEDPEDADSGDDET